MKRYDFELLPAGSRPGPADEAKPGRPGENDDKRPDAAKPGTGAGPSAQGGASKQAAQAAATRTDADGNLADTGTSSATAPLALASAVTLVLGAGAVLAVRRRKAADNV
jgi:colicin import membrane protein